MTSAPAPRAAIVIAFDGVLADTLALRGEALRRAAAQHGITDGGDALAVAVAGRTVAETVDWLRANAPAAWTMDETTRDLLVLAAHQGCRRLMAHGVSFAPSVVARLQQAATRGERVVLRADSARSEVAPLLTVLGVETLVTWLRASDDPGGPTVSTKTSTVERSWVAIGERLSRWQCDAAQVEVHESCAIAAAAAAPFARQVRSIGELV